MRKYTLFSGVLAAMTAVGVQAANPTFVELTNLSDIVSNGYFHGNAVLVDVNNDGNFEIIGKGRDLNNGWATDIFMLTGDGFSFNNKVAITDPDGNSWERVVIPIDYNCDGNVDLILGNSWGAKLLVNNGDGTFDAAKGVDAGFGLDGEISIDGDDAEKWYQGLTAVADFNGDGYPDILTFCGNPREDQGTPVLFINEAGSGKFTKNETTGLLPQRAGTIAVGDFNRDGLIDVAVSGWNDNFGNHCVKVYKNNGDVTFSEVASESLGNAKAGTDKGGIRFVDINNDGYLDLFITGESCPNDWAKCAFVFKNENGTDFSKLDANLTGVSKAGADWCDLNGDGFIDLVFSGESANGAKTIIAYNNGDGTFTQDETSLAGHRGGVSVELGDFNNNLVPDVILMGYNDNGPHFQIYNAMMSRGMNTAPQAPTSLVATADGNATVFTWAAGSDKETPAEALRYNVYAKLNDGKIITLVPADPATGKLKQANVDASVNATTYRLEIAPDQIAEWGVQSIDGGKAASQFVLATTSGVEAIAENVAALSYENGVLVANAATAIEIYDLSGACVLKVNMAQGEALRPALAAGMYLVKSASATLKVIVK